MMQEMSFGLRMVATGTGGDADGSLAITGGLTDGKVVIALDAGDVLRSAHGRDGNGR